MIGSKGRPPYKNPSAMSEQLKDFIEKCTIMDPAQRPTTEQMLSVSTSVFRIHMVINSSASFPANGGRLQPARSFGTKGLGERGTKTQHVA